MTYDTNDIKTDAEYIIKRFGAVHKILIVEITKETILYRFEDLLDKKQERVLLSDFWRYSIIIEVIKTSRIETQYRNLME
jgi:hypothetical protein